MRPIVKILGVANRDGVAYRTCPRCETQKSMDDFGLRRFKAAGPSGEDVITNQSWCRSCRSYRSR
jgi:hypothetical protein